jgi:hypothetical protein
VTPPPGPAAVWPVDHADVCTIWSSTLTVFGNSLWHQDVDEALDTDEYREYVDLVEDRSGQSLFDCVLDAVAGLHPGDPSEVFAVLHRAFLGYGVELRFADHYRYGDVLARAAAIAAGVRVAEPPRSHHLDAAAVAAIWSDAENHGYDDDFRPHESFDADLCDDLAYAAGGEVFLSTTEIVRAFTDDTDPSRYFQGLQRYGAEHGIEITFAPHPEHGDVLARAAALG